MILITVYSPAQWKVLEEVAKGFQSKGDEVSLCCFNSSQEVSQHIRARCESLHIPFYNQADIALEAQEKIKNSLIRKIKEKFLPFLIGHPLEVLVRGELDAAENILAISKARLLIVAEDGIGGNVSLIHRAKQLKIPVAVVPFGVGASEDYDNFIDDHYRTGTLNFLPSGIKPTLRKKIEHWIRATKYGEVTVFPLELILARLKFHLDVPQPWVVHGGVADLIMVESKAMKEHYLKEKIKEEKLCLTGSIYCDVVFHSLEENPAFWNSFKEQKRIGGGLCKVLVSLPPSYHSSRSELCEFKTYSDLVKSTCQTLSNLNAEVTISVHPNSSAEDREILENSGFRIAEEWLVSEIPKHDVFVTCFSSTTRWAIACAKPVVNIDFYQFRLRTYQGVGGVVNCSNLKKFESVMRKLSENNETYREYASLQKEKSKEWGILDGKNFDRIYEKASQLKK